MGDIGGEGGGVVVYQWLTPVISRVRTPLCTAKYMQVAVPCLATNVFILFEMYE